jgi:hypothetical protein
MTNYSSVIQLSVPKVFPLAAPLSIIDSHGQKRKEKKAHAKTAPKQQVA